MLMFISCFAVLASYVKLTDSPSHLLYLLSEEEQTKVLNYSLKRPPPAAVERLDSPFMC